MPNLIIAHFFPAFLLKQVRCNFQVQPVTPHTDFLVAGKLDKGEERSEQQKVIPAYLWMSNSLMLSSMPAGHGMRFAEWLVHILLRTLQ